VVDETECCAYSTALASASPNSPSAKWASSGGSASPAMRAEGEGRAGLGGIATSAVRSSGANSASGRCSPAPGARFALLCRSATMTSAAECRPQQAMASRGRPAKTSARADGAADSLAGRPLPAILTPMNAVTLPPDLERFADDIVAQGRFRDVAEVVRAGMTLLQRAEAERAAFVASLEEARAEGERDGFLTIDEVMRDIDALLEEMANSRA
jgi:putative addiction module CopG family antidote